MCLVSETVEDARIAVPVSVTQVAEQLANERGAEIVYTKRSDAHLMEVASQESVAFAGSAHGGFIWPDFLPAYDATATLARILDLLAGDRAFALVDRGVAAARATSSTRRCRRRGSGRGW